MTKPQTKQTITLETIIETIGALALADARAVLYERTGASLSIRGVVEKVIKRDGLKLYVRAEGVGRTFMIFADFTDEEEQAKVVREKMRKGSQVAFTGDFRTVGHSAATMDNCRIITK